MKAPATSARGTPRTGTPKRARPTARAHARLPLAALRMFAAVAAHCSFSEAAAALHLSTAAVSMQIKALEDYLQVRLLRRTSQGAELTVEGERLLPYVQRGLDELEQGFRMVRAERSGGVLVASMLSSFLNSWLTSRLPGFLRHAPADRPAPAMHGAARRFLALRRARGDPHGARRWPRLHAEKLFDEYLCRCVHHSCWRAMDRWRAPVPLQAIRCCIRARSHGKCGSMAATSTMSYGRSAALPSMTAWPSSLPPRMHRASCLRGGAWRNPSSPVACWSGRAHLRSRMGAAVTLFVRRLTLRSRRSRLSAVVAATDGDHAAALVRGRLSALPTEPRR